MLRQLVCIALAGLCALPATAQKPKVEKYKLPNGLTVILHEDRSLPIACVNLWFRVGSKDEPDRRSGFAHLFEHLMFMGTKRVPTGEFDRLMERYGGSNNASTAEDRTNYFSTGPSVLLPTLLWMEADRLEQLGVAMDQKKLDLQRDVVRNERRQGVDNAPYGKAYEAINGLMFPKGHPYHTSVIGSHEDLEAAKVEDVVNFFDTFYVPNNASLVVAGDFDSKTIKPLIASMFNALPRKNDIVRRPVPPVPAQPSRKIVMVDRVDTPKIILVWHSPAAYKPGDAEMRLAASVLTDGQASRLYDELVVKQSLATSVSAFQGSLLLGSLFFMELEPRDGVSPDKLLAAANVQLAKFAKEGPTRAELDRQVHKFEAGQMRAYQSILSRADHMNEYEFYLGDPAGFEKALDPYRRATPESVRKVVDSTLGMEGRLAIVVLPQAQVPAADPIDKKPALLPSRHFTAPAPTTFKLSNGLTVQVWLRPQSPQTSMQLDVKGGAAGTGGASQAGWSALVADMLAESSDGKPSKLEHEQFDQLGADFSISAGANVWSVSLNVPTGGFDSALGLMAGAIRKPAFKAEDWNRVKALAVQSLQQALNDPGTVADRVARSTFFGDASPYGLKQSGTVASLKAATLPGVKSLWSTWFQPDRAALFVVTDLPIAKLKASLERSLGGWKSQNAPLGVPAIAIRPSFQDLQVLLVDRPGAEQTSIVWLAPGPSFGSKDRLGVEALTTVLGGTFMSRLNANLRENKGYTYGIGARSTSERDQGWLMIRTAVRADVTGASLKEILAENARLAQKTVGDLERDTAVNTRRNRLIESLQTGSDLVSLAADRYDKGAGWSTIADDYSGYDSLTIDILNQMAPTAFPWNRGVLVLVGDKKTVMAQWAGLGLPEPKLVSAR